MSQSSTSQRTVRQNDAPAETFSEAEIADYLRKHPDFFERHLPLLLRLKLPHPTGRSTVSLVERQVSMLRQRNGELERQLKNLVAVAKANNVLVDNIHQLSVQLMCAPNHDSLLEVLETSLREDFNAERAVLILFDGELDVATARPGFVKRYDRSDAALKPFATFLRSARPRCGTLRDRQKELLFDRESDSIVSAALVPIGSEARLGFLAIGSKDADQFNPAQRVDFLARLGDLVAIALERKHDGTGR
jgi:uncharacterized protein YigA (DUF484 family)